MNKTKSAKMQLGRFLILVPVFAIILLSFRKTFTATQGVKEVPVSIAINDTVPGSTVLNSKGYYVEIIDVNGNCTVVVQDKNKKEVKRVLLTEWDANPHKYESLYGEIGKNVAGVAIAVNAIKAKNPDIAKVFVNGNIATVTLKNGKTETYTLSIKDERKAFEERCGVEEIAITTTATEEVRIAESPVEVTEAKEVNAVSETVADNFEITDTKAVMHMRNGKTEEYDLTNEKERQAFEKKFGKIIKLGTPAEGVYSVITLAEPSISKTVAVPAKEVTVTTNTKNSMNATNKVATTVAVSPLEESEVVEAVTVTERRILNLGGLTVIDEGQYILLDNKEVKRDAYDKLRGPYRISFLDRSAAEKKYGDKGKNGAILLQTIH